MNLFQGLPPCDFLGHVMKQENTLMGGYNWLLKHLLMEKRLGNEQG